MYKLTSHPDFETLSPELKASICNGAGPANQWFSSFIPNTMYGLDVKEVFDRHDFDYFKGRTKKEKDLADRNMLENLFIVINNKGGWLQGLRRRRALKYYEFVHHFGDEFFFKGKGCPLD